MKKDYLEAFVKGIGFDEMDNPVILLKTLSGKVLSLASGPFEASAVIIKAENIDPPYPLTHDVFSDFIKQHGYKVEHLEIYGRTNYIHFSRLHYKKGFKKYKINLRPCDGIAVAMRTEAPIMVNRHLFDINEKIASLVHYYGVDEQLADYLDLEKNKTNYV